MLPVIARLMAQPSIAVDLGTANTRVYTSLYGRITERPSSLSLTGTNTKAVTDEYLLYTNNKLATKPLRGGVIVDLKNAITLLKPLVKESGSLFFQPITLATAPTDTTEIERNLLRRALLDSGAAHVAIIPEVWAAAIGAGMDITQTPAQLLIDIGDGVTDMAVFRNGRIEHASSLRVACSDMQKSVRSAIMAKYRIQIYDHDAELLTHSIASLVKKSDWQTQAFTLFALDIVKRCKVMRTVRTKDVVEAIEPVADKIIKMIEKSLKKLPESVYCEILESGICLTGGGACIAGMDSFIASRTNIAVRIAPDPLHAVINGARETLNYWNGKKCWWDNIAWPALTM